jgi:polyhydroxybutyrate depolymerase
VGKHLGVAIRLVLVGATCSLVSALPAGPAAASGSVGHPHSRAIPSAGCRRSASPSAGGEKLQSRSLVTPTASGTYLLSTPGRIRKTRPAPLILLFYGFASNPTQFTALTNLPERGARAGAIVAVPHTQPGETEWQFNGNGTDAAFVHSLVTTLEGSFCIDRAAVFAAGFSAGAAFTIAYSCTHQRQISAIATVAVDFQLGCKAPMPIMAFHGTKDPLVPYRNGAMGASLPGVKVRGTQLNMGDWARLDHCRSRAPRVRVGSQVIRQQWPACEGGAEVRLFTIVGGGHTWPGANPTKGFGLTTQQVSATTRILAFFHHYSAH